MYMLFNVFVCLFTSGTFDFPPNPSYDVCWLDASLDLHCFYVISASSLAQAQSTCAAGSHVATLDSEEEVEAVWGHYSQGSD